MAQLDTFIENTEALTTQLPELARAFPDFRAQLRALNDAGTHGVYMLGTIKSGKSTLINALLGRDVMPRGAGVKTFNQVRVRAGDHPAAVLQFRSAAELRDLLTFDYQLLGFEYQLPDDVYDGSAAAELTALQSRFDAECASDQRLSQVRADPTLDGLLPRALARIQRTLAGLQHLRREFDEDTCTVVQRDGTLSYRQADFADHARWTDSADLAALIRGIEMTLPFPKDLPESLQLVDCQGSDSLNPLDFADVESVIQRADAVLYVIQSRLGIRQADRKLLAHLANAGERVMPVLNVEAFSPMTSAEFEALENQVAADIEQCLGRPAPPLPLIVLRGLLQATGDKDQLRVMKRLWDKQSDQTLWRRLENGQELLRQRLEALSQADSPRSNDDVLAYFRRQASNVARELLDRDERIVGQTSEKSSAEVKVAMTSLIDGERNKLKAAARQAADAAFDSAGVIERELDDFLKTRIADYVEDRPIPAEVQIDDGPGPVIDAALAVFNADWLGDRTPIRQTEVANLIETIRERVLDGAETVVRLMPDELAHELPDVVFTAKAASRNVAMAELYDQTALQRPAPRALMPVVLKATTRHTLTTRYYAGKVQQKVRERLQGTDDAKSLEPSALRSTGLRKFWTQCMRAAFQQAQADRSLAVSNARENYKYQYFFPIIDSVLDTLSARITAAVDDRYERWETLKIGRSTLLDAAARDRLTDYLGYLESDTDRGPADELAPAATAD